MYRVPDMTKEELRIELMRSHVIIAQIRLGLSEQLLVLLRKQDNDPWKHIQGQICATANMIDSFNRIMSEYGAAQDNLNIPF